MIVLYNSIGKDFYLMYCSNGLQLYSFVLIQELNETRTRSTIELEEVDARYQVDFESRLKEEIQAMRAENDSVVEGARAEAAAFFEKKVNGFGVFSEEKWVRGDGGEVVSRRRFRPCGLRTTFLRERKRFCRQGKRWGWLQGRCDHLFLKKRSSIWVG